MNEDVDSKNPTTGTRLSPFHYYAKFQWFISAFGTKDAMSVCKLTMLCNYAYKSCKLV